MKLIRCLLAFAVLLLAAPASADISNGSVRITSGSGAIVVGVGPSGTTATSANGLFVLPAKQGTSAPGAGNFGFLGLDASGNLSVNCVTGCTAGGSFTDNTAFTASTTTESNVGGVFNDGLAAVTSGNAAAIRITPSRGVHVSLRTQAGVELLGQTTMAASIPVAIASNQGAIPVTESGTWNVNTTPGTGVGTFSAAQQSVTASAVALGTNTTKAVCVRSIGASTQPVYLGPSGVTTGTGYELSPGDAQCWPVSNSNLLFVIAPSTGATVSYDWVN